MPPLLSKQALDRKRKLRAREAGLAVAGTETFDEFLARLGVSDWDYLLVGDGSGSNWGWPCGWGCVSVERRTMERAVWAGAVNYGTVNFAEVMAYVQPLSWIVPRDMEYREDPAVRRNSCAIHIVTDSEYCRDAGNSADRRRASVKNGLFWHAIDGLSRHGFVLKWHWMERETSALNSLTDRISKMARTNLKGYNILERLERAEPEGVGKNVYEVCPSD